MLESLKRIQTDLLSLEAALDDCTATEGRSLSTQAPDRAYTPVRLASAGILLAGFSAILYLGGAECLALDAGSAWPRRLFLFVTSNLVLLLLAADYLSRVLQAPAPAEPYLNRRRFLYGLIASILVEAITAGLRFGVGLRSEASAGGFFAGLVGFRIHHGYVGGAIWVLSALIPSRYRAWRTIGFVLGMGMALSDWLHHFIVLPIGLGVID